SDKCANRKGTIGPERIYQKCKDAGVPSTPNLIKSLLEISINSQIVGPSEVSTSIASTGEILSSMPGGAPIVWIMELGKRRDSGIGTGFIAQPFSESSALPNVRHLKLYDVLPQKEVQPQ